jgi:segregation and condensation protein A
MYRVQLQNFEGPLDLLLFFIRRDELDIYDIPIAYITNQFFEFITFMDELDLGVASEFIYMASTLMSIKAKMMLPREKDEESEFDEADPRYELVQSLLEYKRYKEMGAELGEMDLKTRETYRRGYHQLDIVDDAPDEEPLRDVTLFDLISAYKMILNRVAREEVVHRVELVKTNIEEQSTYIIERLRTSGRLSFWQICKEAPSKMFVIVTFLAILEMVRENRLVLMVGEETFDFSVDLPTTQAIINA